MELVLELEGTTQARTTCDQTFSHTFDLRTLSLPSEADIRSLLQHPEEYGKKLYDALFPADTGACRVLESQPDDLVLILLHADLDAIPWEYVYGRFGSDGMEENFLVLFCPFVRRLPSEQKRSYVPTLAEGLHILAIPSSPLNHKTELLPIESDWTLLREVIQDVPRTLTLERCRPPTLKRLRELVANQTGRVIHFLGHGGQGEQGAVLCFEQDNADLDEATAQDLMQRLQKAAFLITLSACVSATPGPTAFSNLAASLVRRLVPYALGMRFSVFDIDARTLFQTFYSELTRGSSVEQALFQARMTLARECPRHWVLGVPVLYTSLAESVPGFVCPDGIPTIQDPLPSLDLAALPSTDGPFQGRFEELIVLGSALTAARCPSLLTIHGGGGQGKTALVRKAAERFAWAWPGGVWAITLETPPTRATFLITLAQFLGMDIQTVTDPKLIEQFVLQRMNERRTLLVLDNAETVLEAVERADPDALDLVAWWKLLLTTSATLLVTSRDLLNWADESYLDLGGLQPGEGAALFQQCAAARASETNQDALLELSRKLDGHPLSLRLLGRTFGSTALPFSALLATTEEHLVQAFDKYVGPEHRHYKLYACIDVSIQALDFTSREQLSGLWIFHAPFLAETAVAIFDPDTQEAEHQPSPIRNALYQLWQRGLLSRQRVTVRDGLLTFYALSPTTRPYVEDHLEQAYSREILLSRLGAASLALVQQIYRDLDRSAAVVAIAQFCREDLERGLQQVVEVKNRIYTFCYGWILYRLGKASQGLELLENTFEAIQGTGDPLFLQVSNNLALAYRGIGQPQRALELYEQALLTIRELRDKSSEATTLNNLASTYRGIGQPQRALELYEQALLITQEVGDSFGEAVTLHNLAVVYQGIGQPQQALDLYGQALLVTRDVGNRLGEATTLNNMAFVYRGIGQPQRALELHQQALPIMREVGNHAREATTLNGLAMAYDRLGQPQRALDYFQQALPITQEVKSRGDEAVTLLGLAGVYNGIGQPQRALDLYKQALSIMQEVGDRSGEATTLNNLAEVYQEIGRPQQALELYRKSLPITREVGDRSGEAAILNNLASIYGRVGQPLQALDLFQQALPIMREVGDRTGEATTLNNLAGVYWGIGQPQQALGLYMQALPIMQDVENRAGEAVTLHNLAMVYDGMRQSQQALDLYMQALLIRQEVGDRAGEAATLDGLAGIYGRVGPLQQALELYEQALSIMREVDNRVGEATTLHNLAGVYRKRGQPEQALDFYKQSLLITREVGDCTGEAATLNGLAYLYKSLRQYTKALEAFEASIQLEREISHPAGEISGLVGLAHLLYQHLEQPSEAIEIMEQAQVRLRSSGLMRDASGYTLEDLDQFLIDMRQGNILTKTVYSIPLPFDEDLIPRSISALQGGAQKKMEYTRYLTGLAVQTTDEQFKALLTAIQLALFGGDLMQLGQDLGGVYRQAWDDIVAGAEKEQD